MHDACPVPVACATGAGRASWRAWAGAPTLGWAGEWARGSCAGHFIEAHLDKAYTGGWLHVDMAGPSARDERGTGYGVGLVLALLDAPGFA